MKSLRIAAGLLLIAAPAALRTASVSARPQLPHFEVRAAAARVVVPSEDRPDITYRIVGGDPRLVLNVRCQRGRLIVDGGLESARFGWCRIRPGPAGTRTAEVRITGLGQVAWSSLPQILVAVPMDVKITASGAVFGSVGRARSIDLANDGYGDWALGDVTNRLRISQAGAGSSRAGQARSAQLRLAG